jgi:hypothetical protein
MKKYSEDWAEYIEIPVEASIRRKLAKTAPGSRQEQFLRRKAKRLPGKNRRFVAWRRYVFPTA